MQLLRNYTQNIDTLESLAGVTKVLQCHGEELSRSESLYLRFTADALLQDHSRLLHAWCVASLCKSNQKVDLADQGPVPAIDSAVKHVCLDKRSSRI